MEATIAEMSAPALVALGIFSICSITFAITYIQCTWAIHRQAHGKSLPWVPYYVPFVANTVDFARDIGAFMMRTTARFGYDTPITISLLGGQRIHLVSNADYIASMLSLKTTSTLTMNNSVILAMETVFGAPRHIMAIWRADESGINKVPLSGSQTAPHNRVFMNSHKSSLKYLSGTSLKHLSERYMADFQTEIRSHAELSQLEQGEVYEVQDLFAFVQKHMFNVVVGVLCGPHIFRLNPTLAEDFWAFDATSPKLFQGLPRWMASKEHARRDKMLANIKRWHAFAKEQSAPDLFAAEHLEKCENQGRDEFYGTNWVRHRALLHAQIEGFDEDGCAADDLGFLFASLGNAIPAAFWLLYYVLRTPGLAARVRAEVLKYADGMGGYDLTKMTGNPLLSSIYAETLRLRNASLVTRTPLQDYTMGPWRVPRGELIGMSNWVTCRNEELWSTGPPGEERSLDDFCPERFIVDPQVPGSGALRRDLGAEKEKEKEAGAGTHSGTDARFSLDGLSGGWIPYGGGSTMCPGRHFAKMEILGSAATLLGKFDIELDGAEVKPNMDFMMLGVLPPNTKIAAKFKLR